MSIYVEGKDSEEAYSEKKSDFGKESLLEIDCGGRASLNGTTVAGKVDAGNSVKAKDADVGAVGAGTSVELISTICRGKVDAGRSITLVDSKVLKETNAGGSITAYRTDLLGLARSGKATELHECPHVHSISAGGALTLRETTVQENAVAGGAVSIKNSKIGGTLTCASTHLTIEGSSIDTIDLRCKRVSLCKFVHTNHLFEYPFCQEQSFLKRVGNVAFHVLTLCIPLMFYYLTGQQGSSGFGRVTIQGGSVFIGSGAIINGVDVSKLQSEKGSSNEAVAQILELRNCRVRNIIFEGKKGEVVLAGDSQVTGIISGGKIRT